MRTDKAKLEHRSNALAEKRGVNEFSNSMHTTNTTISKSKTETTATAGMTQIERVVESQLISASVGGTTEKEPELKPELQMQTAFSSQKEIIIETTASTEESSSEFTVEIGAGATVPIAERKEMSDDSASTSIAITVMESKAGQEEGQSALPLLGDEGDVPTLANEQHEGIERRDNDAVHASV